jgi:MFS family permease
MTATIVTEAAPASWRQFNRFWWSQSFAQAAGQILNVGFPLIAAELLDLRPAQDAATTSLQFIPYLVATPFAGVLVDRVNRVRLVLICHASRAVLLALVGLLAAGAHLSVAGFFTAVCVAGAVNAVASIATMALVPDLAPESGLVKANSRLQLSMSVTQVIGPALAGGLLAITGNLVFFAIAVAFLVATVLGLRIRSRPGHGRTEAVRESWWRSFAAGVRFLRKVRLLVVLLLQMTLFNFFEQAVITLFILFSLRELGMSSGQVGLVLGAGALGSVAAASLAPQLKSPRGEMFMLLAAAAVSSAAPAAIPFLPDGSVIAAMLVGGVAFCFYGFGLTTFNVHSNAVRHAEAPRELQGRLAAVFLMSAFTSVALGGGFGGVLAEALPYRSAIGLACVGLLASTGLFAVLLHAGRRHRPAGLPG